jgi:WD40 repeat protein
MNACPELDELRQLWAGTLEASRREAMETHVENCDACAEASLRLFGTWGETRRREPRPPASLPDPALAFLEELKGRPPAPAEEPGANAAPAIAGYEIREVLGRGGMGVVYKAWETALRRFVALKMLLPGSQVGAEEAARLPREAMAAAGLQHPNILQVHAIGETPNGEPYLLLELAEQGNLAQRLNHTPQPPVPSAALVETLARAMEVAHRQGLVHRDLKPSNVLLAADGTPKIGDFGLAKSLAQDSAQTRSGITQGTPSYMAPEQAAGRTGEIGPATDVYGLGAILYELLAGRPPFQAATSWDTVLQVIHEEPVPPRRLLSKVPRDLETICLQCLRKEPRKRYATALDLAEDLRRFQAGEAIRARRVLPWERAWKWARRRPATAVGFVLAFLVVLLGLGLVWMNVKIQDEAERLAEGEVRELLFRAEKRLQRATQGARQTTQDVLDGIPALLRQVPRGPVREQLARKALSLWAESLSVPDRIERASLPLWKNYPHPWPVAVHPNREEMAIGSPQKPVRWQPGQPFELPKDVDLEQELPRLWYSPDGRLLFAPAKGGLEVWDENLAGCVARLEHSGPVLAIGFAGQQIGVIGVDGALSSWSWGAEFLPGTSGKLEGLRPPLKAAALDGCASTVAAADKDGQVGFFQLPSGKRLPTPVRQQGLVTALAWSPDNSLLAVGTTDGCIEVGKRDGEILYRVPAFAIDVTNLVFSPDGRYLLAGFRSGGMKMFDTATGGQVLAGDQVPWGFAGNNHWLAGSHLEAAGFSDLIVPEAVRHLHGHRALVERMVWSGDQMVTLDTGFEVRVWDLVRGVSTATFRMSPSPGYSSNDGMALDGGQLAYANPWEAVVYDVHSQKVLGTWHLDRTALGNRVASLGEGKFLLVREEEGQGSVAYEFAVGKDARRWVLRPAVAGERGFFNSQLSGPKFFWLGPRLPRQACHVEVIDVATGHTARKELPDNAAHFKHDPSAGLSPSGRYLVISGLAKKMRYDLCHEDDPPRPVALNHTFAEGQWRAFPVPPTKAGEVARVALQRGDDEQPWLEFENPDGSTPGPQFSPGGRYLAWGAQDGTVTVLDLPALEHEIERFERDLRMSP